MILLLAEVCLGQELPIFLWPCTPSAFQQMSMYPYDRKAEQNNEHKKHLIFNGTIKVDSRFYVTTDLSTFGNKWYIHIFFPSIANLLNQWLPNEEEFHEFRGGMSTL